MDHSTRKSRNLADTEPSHMWWAEVGGAWGAGWKNICKSRDPHLCLVAANKCRCSDVDGYTVIPTDNESDKFAYFREKSPLRCRDSHVRDYLPKFIRPVECWRVIEIHGNQQWHNLQKLIAHFSQLSLELRVLCNALPAAECHTPPDSFEGVHQFLTPAKLFLASKTFTLTASCVCVMVGGNKLMKCGFEESGFVFGSRRPEIEYCPNTKWRLFILHTTSPHQINAINQCRLR